MKLIFNSIEHHWHLKTLRIELTKQNAYVPNIMSGHECAAVQLLLSIFDRDSYKDIWKCNISVQWGRQSWQNHFKFVSVAAFSFIIPSTLLCHVKYKIDLALVLKMENNIWMYSVSLIIIGSFL